MRDRVANFNEFMLHMRAFMFLILFQTLVVDDPEQANNKDVYKYYM